MERLVVDKGFSLVPALAVGDLGAPKSMGEPVEDLYVKDDVNLFAPRGVVDANAEVPEGDAHAENPLGLLSPEDAHDDVDLAAPNGEGDLESPQSEGSFAFSCIGFVVEKAENPKDFVCTET